jgi:glyoxylase-like metal-dependent hydrolase (beta-lactamase superfamily II)
VSSVEAIPGHDIVRLRADNPGIFSLTGTNTWIVGRDPAWIVDPGPALPDHVDAVLAEVAARGGAAGVVLTHDHADHAEAAAEVAVRTGAPLHAVRGNGVDHALAPIADGDRLGPLVAVATPGHAPDHVAFIAGDVAFTGDAVLGEGSVFVWPDPGALAGYLAALERLRAMDLAVIAPGHGPRVDDPAARLTQYLEHRRDRERRLLAVLDDGGRTIEQMLDGAWTEVPAELRPAATVTLAAHLDKLEGESRLPDGVERPEIPQL